MSYQSGHHIGAEHAQRQIEEQRAHEPGRERAAETAELVGTATAASIIGVGEGSMTSLGRYLTRTSRSVKGRTGLQGVGAFYVRAELEAIVLLREKAKLRPAAAARVAAALRKLGVELPRD